jgi:hypothetical protein
MVAVKDSEGASLLQCRKPAFYERDCRLTTMEKMLFGKRNGKKRLNTKLYSMIFCQ